MKKVFCMLLVLAAVVGAANLVKTVKPSGGDYTSLETCLNANEGSIAEYDSLLVDISGTFGGADANAVTIHNYAGGKWVRVKVLSGNYRLSVSGSPAITVGNDMVILDGLPITVDGTNNGIVQHVAGITIVRNCTVTGGGAGKGYVQEWYTAVSKINNCLFINFTGNGVHVSGSNTFVYNCDFIRCGAGYGLRADGTATFLAKNCGFYDCPNPIYYGSFSETTNSTTAPAVADSAANDWHLLSSDVAWRDQGTDLSADTGWTLGAADYEGQARSSWDIGADEYVQTAPDTVKGMSYPASPVICSTKTAYSWALTVSQGTADSFQIAPALPAGLAIGKTTGTISGTPSATQAQTTHKVTGYQFGGKIDSCNFVLTINAKPGPVRSGKRWTAVSCARADVQETIDSCADGDTCVMPAGDAAWKTPAGGSPALTLTGKRITLRGAGVTTVIRDSATHSTIPECLIYVGGVKSFQLSRFKIIPNSVSRNNNIVIHVATSAKGWRINKLTVDDSAGSSNAEIYISDTSTGLIDSNTFRMTRVLVYPSTDNGNASWKKPTRLGSDSAVYIEGNTYWNNRFMNAIDANGGGRYVARNNTLTNCYIEAHSLQNGYGDGSFDRATRSVEIYNNVFHAVKVGAIESNYSCVRLRSGTGVIYGNRCINDSASVGFQEMVVLDNVRSHDTYANVLTQCDGTNALDGNTGGQQGWPCLDQIGRAMDAGAGATRLPQASEPVYVWDNGFINPANQAFTYDSALVPTYDGGREAVHIQKGRDFIENGAKAGYSAYAYPHPLSKIVKSTKKVIFFFRRR